MEILSVLLSFGSLLNFAFMQELFTLIIKGVAFAESNYNNEKGEIQKQKCIEFIAQGYNVLDAKFNLPNNIDIWIKSEFIPKSIDFIVYLLKETGFISKKEVSEVL